MICVGCGVETETLCAEHTACLACHEAEMKAMWLEIGNLSSLVQQLQNALRKRTGERVLGSRIIGSMWNPSDPKEKDDLKATIRSIHKHLGLEV